MTRLLKGPRASVRLLIESLGSWPGSILRSTIVNMVATEARLRPWRHRGGTVLSGVSLAKGQFPGPLCSLQSLIERTSPSELMRPAPWNGKIRLATFG